MALVLCLIVVLAQVLIPDFRRPVADATTYSRIAVGLVDAVRYSDAGIAALFGGGYSPAYTAFLAVAAMADDTILSALTCVQDVKAACDLSGLSPLFAAQALMTGMTVFFLFLATRLLVEDRRVVWLTLFIVLGSKTFSNYASLVLTESLAFFLYFFFAWMFARILTSDRPGGCFSSVRVWGSALWRSPDRHTSISSPSPGSSWLRGGFSGSEPGSGRPLAGRR